MTYQVQLPIFSGPLDLLLHLIERAEIDIYDIPIALITEQFLSYLRTIEILDLEMAGEFLLMAATLMQIKAKMLLPRPVEEEEPTDEGEEEDPRRELVDRLLAYRQVKEAAAYLRAYEEESRRRYPRGIELPVDEMPPVALAPGLTVWDLLAAFRAVLAQLTEGEAEIVVPQEEQITVKEAMGELLGRLKEEEILDFDQAFRPRRSRRGLVVLFIALLELIRLGYVMVFQEKIFGRIAVRLRPEAREAWG